MAALMDCMLGPVEDVTSITYQRLRQLIDAHVRLISPSLLSACQGLCCPPPCATPCQHHMRAGSAPAESAGLSLAASRICHLLPVILCLPWRGADGAARAPWQREVMLHMSQTDAKMVSKIHCMLKKVAAPPGVWAKCLVRACMSPYHPR